MVGSFYPGQAYPAQGYPGATTPTEVRAPSIIVVVFAQELATVAVVPDTEMPAVFPAPDTCIAEVTIQ